MYFVSQKQTYYTLEVLKIDQIRHSNFNFQIGIMLMLTYTHCFREPLWLGNSVI